MNYERALLMSNNSNILINDSCILFDLLDLGLIREFFRLEYIKFTTSHVISEIENKEQLVEITTFIENESLIVDAYGTIESILAITENHPGLSYTDGSVFELAMRKSGILLTSDKNLRNFANSSNLSVKGMLWIVEHLYENKIISVDAALEKLNFYPQINTRIPKKELNELITKLSLLAKQ